MSERTILTVKDGKIVNTGKIRLPDGTIRVQPEGGIQFIPIDEDNKMKAGGVVKTKTKKVKKETVQSSFPVSTKKKEGTKARGMGAATKGGTFRKDG
tara:strand:+ start:70 stop:360 length:291 start_codon:yes stop_codon:yes gene_type:complete